MRKQQVTNARIRPAPMESLGDYHVYVQGQILKNQFHDLAVPEIVLPT